MVAMGKFNDRDVPESTMKEWVVQAAAGSDSAWKKVMEYNRERVRGIIKKYNKANVLDFDDMEQEGFIGLWLAVKTYDPDRGTKFSTYAHINIKRFILEAIRKAWKAYKNEVEAGLTPHLLTNGSCTIDDHLDSFLLLLQNLRDSGELEESEFDIITSRYYLENTLQEIAHTLNVTRERVRQIESKILNKLEAVLDK